MSKGDRQAKVKIKNMGERETGKLNRLRREGKASPREVEELRAEGDY